MNFEELIPLDAAAQSGQDGLGAKPTVGMSVSMQENHARSNAASFFGIVTAARQGIATQSLVRIMTTGGRSRTPRAASWGPTESLPSRSPPRGRPWPEELRALVARQAAAAIP